MKKYWFLPLAVAIFVLFASCDALTGATGATGAAGEDATEPSFVYSPSSSDFTCVAAGGGRVVAATNGTGYIGYRTASGDWTVQNEPEPTYTMNDLAYGGGTFVGVGLSGVIYYSQDGGVSWASTSCSLGEGVVGEDVRSIAYGAGRFVAVATNGESTGHVMTSSDGINWTWVEALGENGYFSYVAYVNGRFVAVESPHGQPVTSTVITSTDGLSWTSAATLAKFSEAVVGIAYGNGYYLLLGSGGTVLRSGDLSSWSALDTPDPLGSFAGLAFDGSRFYLLGSGGEVYSTANGLSWRSQSPLSSQCTYGDIIWASDVDGGVFVAARTIIQG